MRKEIDRGLVCKHCCCCWYCCWVNEQEQAGLMRMVRWKAKGLEAIEEALHLMIVPAGWTTPFFWSAWPLDGLEETTS